MKKILVYLMRFGLQMIYSVLKLFPTKKNKIVFLSRQSDTLTPDFEMVQQELRREDPEVEIVTICHRLEGAGSGGLRGMLAFARSTLRSMYHLATASVCVLDAYWPAISLLHHKKSLTVIQMWHALGNMKKFGYTALGSKEGRKFSTASLLNMHRGYTSVLISSKSFISDYARGFDIDPSIIYEAPLPRTDLLINSSYRAQQRERIIREFPELGRKLNIVYCPTFRKKTPANQTQAAAALADAIDYDKYNLIVKCHPLDDLRINNPHVFQHYPSQYDMLFVADYVISDYSTVIYEAGLLDLPVFLYAYDWPDYSKKRSLYIDPKRDIPTLFTDDAEAIVRAIEHDDFDHAAYQAFIRRNVAIPEHGSCTARVVEHVFDLIAAR